MLEQIAGLDWSPDRLGRSLEAFMHVQLIELNTLQSTVLTVSVERQDNRRVVVRQLLFSFARRIDLHLQRRLMGKFDQRI